MKKNKSGNSQGVYTPTPVTYTKTDGTTATWCGRGPRPSEIKAMFEAGTYVPPSVKAKEAAKAAKAAAKAAKATPAVAPVTAPVTETTVTQ